MDVATILEIADRLKMTEATVRNYDGTKIRVSDWLLQLAEDERLLQANP